MPIWEAVLLGVVQGLTEFLPISSTAHLLVVRALLGHAHPEDAFTVVIQLGTLVAVFAYFRQDLARIVRGVSVDLWRFKLGTSEDGRIGWLIALGTVPAVLVGYFLKDWLKRTFFNLPSVAVVSIVFALLMLAAEWWALRRVRRGKPPREQTGIGWLDALWVGLWQACALMPGGSRSGTTITGGLFAGLTRTTAARFSFLLSLPVILGAGLKELADEYQKLGSPITGEPVSLFASGDQVAALITGTLVSAVVGYLSIAFLLRFLQKYSTAVFVGYRLIMGAAILLLLAAAVLR
jgi:undecaprenyl-diphosphatase